MDLICVHQSAHYWTLHNTKIWLAVDVFNFVLFIIFVFEKIIENDK